MADGKIAINGKWYELARDNLLPSGARRWQIGGEPAQPSPGVALQHMDWELSGPHFNSFERIAPGESVGYLGTDYTVDCDTRFEGKLTLSPRFNTVDLSGTGGTPADTNCWTRSYDMNATEFLLVGRGTKWSKVNPVGWTRVNEGSAAVAETITSLLFTRAPGGTQEISVGMRGTAYRVITAIANAAGNDTHAANGSGIINSVMMLGPDRVFGAQDVAAATAATLRGNILTGAVTMASPAWATNATLPGHKLKVNSLGLDGNFVVVGTTRGPQMLDPLYNQFRDLALEVDTNAANCAAMANWQPYGLSYSFPYGTRTQYGGNSVSDGPENFPNNQSPVGLRMTAITGSDRWEYRAYTAGSLSATNTYLVACRPRQAGDPHDNPLSYYCIHRFDATAVGFLGYPGTFDGLLNEPVVIGGSGTDMFYFKTGDDNRTQNYDTATSGIWVGTESMRDSALLKDIVAFELETLGNQLVLWPPAEVKVGISGFSDYLNGTLGYNGTITTDGFHRLLPVNDSGVPISFYSLRHIKPQIYIQAQLASPGFPYVKGKLRIIYRPRPILSQTLQFTGVLDTKTGPGLSLLEAQAALIAAWGAGPVACENPDDGLTNSYIRVDRVDVTEVQDKGNDRDRSGAAVRVATVHAFVWPTTAGQ